MDGVFEGARRAGARQGSEADLRPRGADAGSGFSSFTGTARTLAGGAAAPQQQAAGGSAVHAEERTITITFYRNGIFTVNDGG